MKTDKEIADTLDARERIRKHGGTWVRCPKCGGLGYTTFGGKGMMGLNTGTCFSCDGKGGKWEFPLTR